MAIGFATFTFEDYDGEVSTARVNLTELDGTNFTTQNGLAQALESAIGAITLGAQTKYSIGNREEVGSGPASSANAQRELKWLVQYHDNTTSLKYTMEIPCPDLSKLDANDRANAEIGDADVVDAFVTAFEACARSPVDNAVTVDEITLVGRNR